jgi:hypothetical protein
MNDATNTASLAQALVASVDLTTLSDATLRELARDPETFTAAVKVECARRNAMYQAQAARIAARKAAAKRGINAAAWMRNLSLHAHNR